MFFLIRSAFWLTVVFMAMPPLVDATRSTPRTFGETVAKDGAVILTLAKDAALDQTKTWCAAKPDRCLADAARLTALVSANQFEDDGLADAVPSGSALAQPTAIETLPVPRADPRRHGVSAIPAL